MRLFTTVAGLRCYLELHRSQQYALKREQPISDASPLAPAATVGLVPTMGALHQGHLSLIQRARQENALVVVSIFVNPLQFGPTEDFQQYPRTLETDQKLCEQAGVDAIFAPNAEELYGSTYSRQQELVTQVVPPQSMAATLCGRARLGHFQGVATVVTKLLQLVQPDRAYFGRKDAQQLAIIQRLVRDLNIPVEVVGCPTMREASGLALSSRNQYLSAEEREQAAAIYRGLLRAKQEFQAGERDTSALIDAVKVELATVPIQPEYIELVHPMTMAPLDKVDEAGLLAIAARLGSTRLIDNVVLQDRQPIVAIDGPAGAGKSTVTRQIAQTLGLLYLDTGAMYRALTWRVLQSGIDIQDEPAIAELVSKCEIQLVPGETPQDPVRVWIDQQEVTEAIRDLEVTSNVSAIAAQPAVREELVKQQQRYGRKGGIAIEGRDIGTHVFPDAELKIFLTASVQERARRRQQDLKNQGKGDISLDELERLIYERDRKDSTRTLAPLQKAVDAIEINTDGLTISEVIARIVALYHERVSTTANA